jgi:hypothetical protein
MTLFELQEWLGHSTPAATQHYAKITPTKLAKSYADSFFLRSEGFCTTSLFSRISQEIQQQTLL